MTTDKTILTTRDWFAALKLECDCSDSGMASAAQQLSITELGTGQIESPSLNRAETMMRPKVVKKDVHLKLCGSWAEHALPPED